MKKIPVLVLVAALAPAAHGAALTIAPDATANMRTLVGDIYANGRCFEFLEALSDDLGPRLTGTDNYERSVRWAVDTFHAIGIADVRLEPVLLPHGWQRGAARAQLMGRVPRALHVAAFGWSPPTPKNGVKAPVVSLPDTTDEAIAAAKVRGRIVLIDRAAVVGPAGFHHGTVEEWQRERRGETLYARLRDAGALAALVYAKTANQVLPTGDPVDGAVALPLPMAYLGEEDALLLRRQLAKGAVAIELVLETSITGPITVHNVVAELRGREQPDDVVMLGAHLDSWDFATGEQDIGRGVAQVVEAARAIAALGTAPRRSVRFALWASEEQGLNGSLAYVRAHGGEMRHVVAYLNTDDGAGRPKGWLVGGSETITPAIAPLAALLTRLGGSAVSENADFDTDSGGFLLAGVPAFDLDVVDDDYDPVVHHKPADTLDKVDAHDLTAGAAMLAVTAYALAESAERPLRRFSRQEVEELLNKNGALEYIRTSPLNDLWRE
jgi:carboxypeptidase Q